MRQINTGELAFEFMIEAGLANLSRDTDRNLRSGRPNIDNLVSVVDDGRELFYAADGMPLIGGCPNSYDHAPGAYAPNMVPYPRTDSASRQVASEKGARMNQGASEHLQSAYGDSVAVLRGIVSGYRQQMNEPERNLNLDEASLILNAAVALPSYMMYRKDGRIGKGKLPPEVGLLHRSMSGVRVSLLTLFVRDDSHGFRPVSGWDEKFSAENWHRGVEESGRLISQQRPDRQICPAPTSMIRRVIETVVEPLPEDVRTASMETDYKVDAETLCNYGRAWFRLEQARGDKIHAATEQGQILAYVLGQEPFLSPAIISSTKAFVLPKLRQISRPLNRRINDAFLDAVSLLGYNPKSFQK